MSKVCGIVAEFNPFHNGHRELIAWARQAGATHCVAVMSGNFVQRGSPAVTDKRVRAHCALLGGADLVIELPLPAATATAQRFARGAVGLLAATGCVDMLAFGSESGDVDTLRLLSRAVDEPAVTTHMRALLADGLTFAKARELAVVQVYGAQVAVQLATPNNALGIEYLRQAAYLGFDVPAITTPRFGVTHDAHAPDGAYASASFLRKQTDFALISQFVPHSCAELLAGAMAEGLYPAEPNKLETALLSHLRRLGPEELATLPELSEGLENRLFAAIRATASLSELEAALKTKRYPLARVRRLILAAFLGLTSQDCDTPPPYVRVLGWNRKGQELVSSMKQRCVLPVSTSLARLRALGGSCERFSALEELATDLYTLCLPSPRPCGYEYTARAIFKQ